MKYKVSVFKKRESKNDHSDQVPVTEIVDGIDALCALQQNFAWSPSIFTGWRDKDHWKSAQLLVLDIDNGSLESFKESVKFYEEECLITFTESHRGLKNGKQQADCFRATFFLKEECFDYESYRETLKQLQKKYEEHGTEQGPDIIKYFWKSTGKHTELQTYYKGKKIPLIKIKRTKEETALRTDLSKIPIVSEYLSLPEENLENKRNEYVNKVAFILASHGYTLKETSDIVYSKKLLRELDSRYESVIESAHESGTKVYLDRRLTHGDKFFKNMVIEEFFREFVLAKSMTCSQHGIVSLDGKAFSDDIIIDYMVVETSRYQMKNKSKDTLRALLTVWKIAQVEENIDRMRQTLEFTEPSNEICKFVEAVTGCQHPLDIAVMRHWIWQVKRKFKRMDTKHHIMPIFYGKTRSGKTTAIEKLLQPIKQLSMIAELAMVNDSRNDFNLIEKLVIFFDELGKAEKVVVSNLKQKITSSTITYRRLGTNQNMNGFNLCSFIGATNEPVVDAIVDPTSARRFYEVKTLDKCDWKKINNIDYLGIWQSVNEMEETAPIEEHLFALSESQEDIRAKDYVEEFVIEYSLVPESETSSRFISTMELYLKLKEWLDTQNKANYIPSLSKFSRRLKTFLEKAPVTSVNGVALNGFYVTEKYVGKPLLTSKDIDLSKDN